MKTNYSTATKRNGIIFQILLTVLILNSIVATAQTTRENLDDLILERVKAFDDSIRKLTPKKSPVYLGGDLAISFPQYTLNSSIDQLSGLPVSFIGTNLGGMIGNPIGKLKASMGLYYSNSSVPYTMDMIQGSTSASVYFLRLKKVKYHTFEPYAIAGLSYQRTNFYGHYLPLTDDGSNAQTNYSTAQAPLLGRTGSLIMNVGTGVEYQLEDDNNHFLHFFAEVSYGVLLSSTASNHSFDKTALFNQTSVSVGISLGILK